MERLGRPWGPNTVGSGPMGVVVGDFNGDGVWIWRYRTPTTATWEF